MSFRRSLTPREREGPNSGEAQNELPPRGLSRGEPGPPIRCKNHGQEPASLPDTPSFRKCVEAENEQQCSETTYELEAHQPLLWSAPVVIPKVNRNRGACEGQAEEHQAHEHVEHPLGVPKPPAK